MMITDGDANDTGEFHDAIVRAKKAGLEFLGLGILDEHITRYLDEEECCVIEDLRRLARPRSGPGSKRLAPVAP